MKQAKKSIGLFFIIFIFLATAIFSTTDFAIANNKFGLFSMDSGICSNYSLLLLDDAVAFQLADNPKKGNFSHLLRNDMGKSERWLTFALVYGVSWGIYYIDQHETIKEHGSFDNWYKNIFKLHFDKDSYTYNLIIHPITGHYLYLFWRSRGLSKIESFGMSLLNVFAFEFLVETTTEIPSVQDLYQTAIYGMLLGLGMEQLSIWCHNWDNVPGHILGYIFNPFTLFNFSSYGYKVQANPEFSKNHIGYSFKIYF